MSFQESSIDIKLDDGHILKASLFNEEGEKRDAEMDLNEYIGNDNGSFYWGGANFEESANDIELSIEGPGIPVLRANLVDMNGEAIEANINLAERISNDNGELVFV